MRFEIDQLLRDHQGSQRQECRIRSLLLALQRETFEVLSGRVVPSWQPVSRYGGHPELLLILSGNASVAVPKRDTDSLNKYLDDLEPSDSGTMAKLRENSDCSPIVLSKADLIGAAEFALRRTQALNFVISGTFFKTLHAKSPLELTLLTLPAESKAVHRFVAQSITENALILNYLLSYTTHKGNERINHVLSCCLAGLLPIYRAFYQTAGEEIRVVGNHIRIASGRGTDAPEESDQFCLSRADAEPTLLGVELTTTYLNRCFGFAEDADLEASVSKRDIMMYSHGKKNLRETVPSRVPADQARLEAICEHKDLEDRRRGLAPESILFVLRFGRSAKAYCDRFCVDFEHRLFQSIDFE